MTKTKSVTLLTKRAMAVDYVAMLVMIFATQPFGWLLGVAMGESPGSALVISLYATAVLGLLSGLMQKIAARETRKGKHSRAKK